MGPYVNVPELDTWVNWQTANLPVRESGGYLLLDVFTENLRAVASQTAAKRRAIETRLDRAIARGPLAELAKRAAEVNAAHDAELAKHELTAVKERLQLQDSDGRIGNRYGSPWHVACTCGWKQAQYLYTRKDCERAIRHERETLRATLKHNPR